MGCDLSHFGTRLVCVRGRSEVSSARLRSGQLGSGRTRVVRRWRIPMESSVRRLTMAEARIEYLSTGDADPGAVSDFVAASWRRSRGAGVAADRGEVPFVGDIDISSRLVRYSRPIIDRLIDATEDIPLSIALSDNKARVLARVDTTRTIGLLLDGISLAPVRGTSPGYTAEANASHHFDNHTNPRST